MNRRHALGPLVIAALGLTVLSGSTAAQQTLFKEPRAQSASPGLAADDDWHLDFTVLTMEPDGAWGVAIGPLVNQAIAGAISNCKRMSGVEIGCGAYFSVIQAGWSLGIRCGRENIIVAEKILADAERRAGRREIELRTHYAPDLPACVRVVTVDPGGRIVVPKVEPVEIPLARKP